MAESHVEVSSVALLKLQSELKSLSITLEELYNLLSSNVTNLGEEWQDSKYDEFSEEFKSTKEKIHEISVRYLDFAEKYLPPRIELIEKAERSRTGIGR